MSAGSPVTRVGVVGHVEWVDFAVVARVPVAGEIVHSRESFSEPAGGGAVAAVQLRKLAGAATFLTALGDDDAAAATAERLGGAYGVTLHAAERAAPQRRTFTFLDGGGERTITVLGERIVPVRADPLPWEALGDLDGIYVTGGDAGAVRAARAARVLVATPRALSALAGSGVAVDVLVGSATDPGEIYAPGMLDPSPRVVVRTRGGAGGEWEATSDAGWLPAGRLSGTWAATPLPGAPVDAYGCGDSFAAGLTYGLASGLGLSGAIEMGARCGAACLCGRGPYGAQLTLG
ncbi:MAG TPA: PfkB family carbohydrate kinase [Solirubrobacteraceae bacterium]|nr:PfkB family carbohydrate kinase [Solirubrobacteraceae bacterium]